MVGSAACNQIDPSHFLQKGRVKVDIFEHRIAFLLREPAPNGIDRCPGLFKDFLEHKMFVPTLFGHQGVPVDPLRFF